MILEMKETLPLFNGFEEVYPLVRTPNKEWGHWF